MPIPRLTYCPSESSAAARAAISSWLQPVLTAVSLISVAFRSRSRGGLLDLLAGGLLRRQLDDPVHEDTRHVYVVGVDLAGFDDLLRLDDRESSTHRDGGVEVLRGLVEAQVAVPVGDGAADQRDVCLDGLLEHHLPAVEAAGFLWRGRDRDGAVRVVAPGQAALGDRGAHAGGCEERSDAGAAGTHPLRERALGSQLDLELTGEVLPRERKRVL